MLICKDGYTVYQTKTHRCACYAVETAYHRVLIDTSMPFEKRAMLKSLRESGTLQIDAIFLTHCHSDHVANARYYSELFRCPVYLAQPGLSLLHKGSCRVPKGTNPFSRLISWLVPRIPFYHFTNFRACPLAEPLTDAVVKRYLGNEAALLETPGHSADSVSILLGQHVAFVGDAMVNVAGKLYPPFADEPETVIASWKRLLDSNCTLLYPAHGKPLRREKLLIAYQKESSKRNECF